MNDATLQFTRADYLRVLAEVGMTHEQVLAMTENTNDQMPMPTGFDFLHLAPSPIAGTGLFTTKAMTPGAVIGPARINGKRTPLGRYANHSPWPNTEFHPLANGDMESVALCLIPVGGEILNDYRQGAKLWGAEFDAQEVSKTLRERQSYESLG